MRRILLSVLAIAGMAMALSACETPAAPSPVRPLNQPAAAPPEAFEAFAPNPSRTSTIDYDVLDEFYEVAVLETGRSLRRRAKRPQPLTGTRVVQGHDSSVRLEGNKVVFSQFDQEVKDALQDYVISLTEIGNRVDIATFPRNEQLAYWFNLHNALVISTIADNYPVIKPRKIEPFNDGVSLHDARMVTINGVPMSLKDIRTRIVYRYWSDPKVMYGFFHGDLASPNIRRQAWRGAYLSDSLDRNATEFVNSLRGVDMDDDTLVVSPLYEEGIGTLFVNWPADLISHLRVYAGDKVLPLLGRADDVAFGRYEDTVADLAGGEPYQPKNLIASSDGPAIGLAALPPSARELAQELEAKIQVLRKNFNPTARVVIIDEETDDPGEPVE